MKQLTNDQKKIDLVARLVKEGAIDFVEAIQLLEVETRIDFIPFHDGIRTPWPINQPLRPWPTPNSPWWGTDPMSGQLEITCDLNGNSKTVTN